MRILIVEDEARSANRLKRMVAELRPGAEICGPLGGVDATRAWLDRSPRPDLVLLDIRLEDGDAFTLLDTTGIDAPVVFCTAYCEYALRAFQVNSIDYLLKPIEPERLSAALDKYATLHALRAPPEAWRCLRGSQSPQAYRDRFLIKRLGRIEVVPASRVLAVEAWLKASRLHLTCGEEAPFDEPMYRVAQTLDPGQFVQISRRAVVRAARVDRVERLRFGAVAHIDAVGRTFQISRARLKALLDAMAGARP